MDRKFSLFIVDDDVTARMALGAIFGQDYDVELFETAEDCLSRVDDRQPDLFLLDVSLPGMDGYALCRELKTKAATAAVPVIFVSGHDDLESRLHGYDMGGDDFIVKPYSAGHVRRRVEAVREIRKELERLRNQAAETDQLVSLVLSNIDEYAILIQFLRNLNTCVATRDLGCSLLALLRKYRLNGAVQLRLRTGDLTLGEHGDNNPLETSIINHVRTLDRIFEFKQRAVFNFPVLTVMINNMPTADAELCGRIRDNLAIAVESADSKLQSMLVFEENMRTRRQINELVNAIHRTVDDYAQKYNTARYQGAIITREMLDEMIASFSHIGISFEQEEALENLIRGKTSTLIDLYDFGETTRATLEALGSRLAAMLDNDPDGQR